MMMLDAATEAVARNYFVNRCPLMTRFLRIPTTVGVHTQPSVPEPELGRQRMLALQHLMDDLELLVYRTLMRQSWMSKPIPTEGDKVTDLIRAILDECRENSGNPDVVALSVDNLTDLMSEDPTVRKVDAGVTALGVPITAFEAPFLDGVSLIFAPLLKPRAMICLNSHEVRFDPAEGAVKIDHPMHHAWVEGV